MQKKIKNVYTMGRAQKCMQNHDLFLGDSDVILKYKSSLVIPFDSINQTKFKPCLNLTRTFISAFVDAVVWRHFSDLMFAPLPWKGARPETH